MKYTGYLHVHSTYSYDGSVPLSEIVALLHAAGHSFVCMSEHTDTLTTETAAAFVAACREHTTADFVVVPGFEVPYGRAHLLALGATTLPSTSIGTDAELDAWRRAAPLFLLAHPVRNHFVVPSELAALLDGVEVWNQQYDGKLRPRTKSVRSASVLALGTLRTGGLDFHRGEHVGAPVVTLDVSQLTEAAVIGALKNGSGTFGSTAVTLPLRGSWQPTLGDRFLSSVSVRIIWLGKFVNRTLKRLGLRLPRFLRVAIRSRI